MWRADGARGARYRVIDTGRGVRVVAWSTARYTARRVRWVDSIEAGRAVAQRWEDTR